MTSILLVTQVILAVIITIIVLLQKSSSIGLGVYSGSNESLFGAKGPASFMAKFTMVLGLVFIINTISLGYFYNKETNKSILDNAKIKIENNATTQQQQQNPLDNFNAPSAPSPFNKSK